MKKTRVMDISGGSSPFIRTKAENQLFAQQFSSLLCQKRVKFTPLKKNQKEKKNAFNPNIVTIL